MPCLLARSRWSPGLSCRCCFDHPIDDRQIPGFGVSAGDRRFLDRARELVLRQILDGRQRLADRGLLWRRGRRRGGGGLSRIVLRLRVLVRREFAFRLGLEIVRGRRGLAFLLFSRMRRGRRRVRLGRSPGVWRGRGLGRRLGLGLLVGRFAVDLLFGRRRGRVIGRLFDQGLRRRLRFLLRRASAWAGAGGCSTTTSTGISCTAVGTGCGQSQ